MISGEPMIPELEAIRERIEKTAREKCGPRGYTISASLGACACPVRGSTALDQILAEADRALYRDKSGRHARSDGRNDRTAPGELSHDDA